MPWAEEKQSSMGPMRGTEEKEVGEGEGGRRDAREGRLKEVMTERVS